MAADILLYQADKVPVGDDQRQHLEFTRDLAQRFNHLYGETFVVPEVMIPEAGARVMGLDDPTSKMSKSNESEYHAVYLLDDKSILKRKIMRSVTDSFREIHFSTDPERAGVNNLLTIYQAISNDSVDAIESYFSDKGYGDLKKAVLEAVVSTLEPLQHEYSKLISDKGYLDSILRMGTEKASDIANDTLKTAKQRVGFVIPS